MSYRSTLHRDGTVTLWDVYAQSWVRTARPADRDLAAMDHAERARVEEHLSRFDPADGVESTRISTAARTAATTTATAG